MIPIPFLKKFQRQDTIGLDWGLEDLKWLKLQTLSSGHRKICYLDYLPLPSDEKEASAVLKDYVLKKGLTGTPTAVSFQEEGLAIRRLELPRMPPDDLQEAVRWQMRDIAEGSMDDYLVRYSLLEETTTPEMVRLTLLGYAIKRSAIQHQTILLQKAGLKPFFLEPTPVSLAFAVEKTCPSAEHEWTACVDVGRKRAYFLAIGNGKLHFVRFLSGVALEQMGETSEDYATKLAVEIQHAVDAFSIAYQVEKIKKIFLAGGGAGIEKLPDFLTKNLGIFTEVLNPLAGLEGTKGFKLGLEKPYLFGPALGLAFLKP
ncbi:MAG: pilus assembly protein PilM [Deltaproteobacteria bacterium]|nr:pilus assembly protein PilM [Deltaproteobacteria bacterium]